MNLPSRGERESATTMRYIGFFFDPTRVTLIRTAISPPRLHEFRREPWQLSLADLLHHLLHLLARGEQLVHLLHRGAAAARDPLAPRAVDHVWHEPLLRGHGADDRPDPGHVLLVHVHPLELLAESGDHR